LQLDVKSIFERQPQAVRIRNERQLDDAYGIVFSVYVIALNTSDWGPVAPPARVGRLCVALASRPQALDKFEKPLPSARSIDLHASYYETLGYAVRHRAAFREDSDFLRIGKFDLPQRVGEVACGRSLAACHRYPVPQASLLLALRDTPPIIQL
jgi:hypothetical protein